MCEVCDDRFVLAAGLAAASVVLFVLSSSPQCEDTARIVCYTAMLEAQSSGFEQKKRLLATDAISVALRLALP